MMDSDMGKCWTCKKDGRIHCRACNFAFYCCKRCEHIDQFRHMVECEEIQNLRVCRGCGKRGATLMRCTACFGAYYCSKSCQKVSWSGHKGYCKQYREHILEFCQRLKKSQGDFPWYIGMSMAEDFLRLYQNEGTNTKKSLRLLFAGVGDLRHILRTVADLPSDFAGQLQFLLNDVGPHVSARNLLLIYCALSGEAKAEYLVQIWYSIYLTAPVLKYIVSVLKALTSQSRETILSKMQDLVDISAKHWDLCVPIWKGWYKLALDPSAADRMMEIRKEKLKSSQNQLTISYKLIPARHHSSYQDFIDNGILIPIDSSERKDALFPNCTMACFNPKIPRNAKKYADVKLPSRSRHPEDQEWVKILHKQEEMVYGVRSDAHAFCCWDYLAVRNAVGLKDDVISMYRTYLDTVFRVFIEKLSTKAIQFYFVIDDFRNLNRYLYDSDKFDRISTSNLGDYYHYPVMLETFGPRLNKENRHSVLITHHENWLDVTDTMGYVLSIEDRKLPIVHMDLRMRKEVLWDVPDVQEALNVCGSPEDYCDITKFFVQSLLIESGAYSILHEGAPGFKPTITHPSDVAKKFELRFRDFYTELNRVIPFKREGNTRRISVQLNNKRFIEWTLASS